MDLPINASPTVPQYDPFTEFGKFINAATDPVKLAWAAGFLDGDGCISAVRQVYKDRVNPSIRLVVCLVQNDIWTLMRFQKILDEKGHLNAITRRSCHNRQAFQLVYNGRHALKVIQKLEPYLVRKRMEAWAAQSLYREGWMGRNPGPKGFPPEVQKSRAYWVNKLRSLK